MHIGIVGAGIVGLTTGLELQNEFRNAKISILANKFNKDTCSYVAAGIFRPGTSFSGPTKEITQKWISDAYYHWNEILKSSDAPLAGVCELSGYIFSKINKEITRNHFIEKLVPVYRQADEAELKLCNGNWKYGSYFTTLLIETGLFLPYATKQFEKQGGQIFEQTVNSFSDLDNKFDVIVNCTGLGAKYLCNDYSLVSIRGQVVKIKAPWIKMAFYGDYDTYIIPGFEGVTLGGCRQYDSWSTDLCKYDSMAIKERCYNMLPSLKNATVIREACGLRPHRSIVRVEPELLNLENGKQLKIVHNYGHCGYGVTTAPGTAKYATNIVRDILSSSNTSVIL